MAVGRENRARASKLSTRAPIMTHADIAARAYRLYTERGGGDGHDVDDWLQAERELVRERTQTSARPKLSKVEAA
jgi:hypothetical protein